MNTIKHNNVVCASCDQQDTSLQVMLRCTSGDVISINSNSDIKSDIMSMLTKLGLLPGGNLTFTVPTNGVYQTSARFTALGMAANFHRIK